MSPHEEEATPQLTVKSSRAEEKITGFRGRNCKLDDTKECEKEHRLANDLEDQSDRGSSPACDSVDNAYHVRLNVESLMGVITSLKNSRTRIQDADHSLLQGYVEVMTTSMIAKESSPLVVSQADVATETGASRSKDVSHCFVWPDSVQGQN